MNLIIGNDTVSSIYSGSDSIDKIIVGSDLVYSSGPVADHIVQIRYWAQNNNIMSAELAATDGTPHITDNGDGSYDLWSDDPCTFIGIAGEDNGYIYWSYNYKFDITKIELIAGTTLKTVSTIDDYGTFAGTEAEAVIIHDTSFVPTSTFLMFHSCNNLKCVNAINTTQSTNKQYMFDNCNALVQPDAAARADITSANGANWANPDPCPIP